MSDRGEGLLELQQTLYTSRNPTRRWLHTTRRDRVANLLTRYRRGTRALEVGPGSGVYLPLLCELFEQVVATDVEREFLTQAPDLPNLSLVEDDIQATALEPASFDLVLCSEVIEHLRDPAAALASIRRLLRPGGVLVLSTPQRHSPLELLGKIAFLPGILQLVRLIYREPVLPPGHSSLLTKRQAARAIETAGFRIVEQDVSGAYLPGLAEAGGRPVLALEKKVERWLAGGPLEGLLWVQYHVAEAV